MEVKVLRDIYNKDKTAFVPEGTILKDDLKPGLFYYKQIKEDYGTNDGDVNCSVFTSSTHRWTFTIEQIEADAKEKNPMFEVVVDDRRPIKSEDECLELVKEYDKTVDQLINLIGELTDKNKDLSDMLSDKLSKKLSPPTYFYDELFNRIRKEMDYMFSW
jgi:hypothetical protein